MRTIFEDSGRRWTVEPGTPGKLRCTSRQSVVEIDAPPNWEKMDASDLTDLIFHAEHPEVRSEEE